MLIYIVTEHNAPQGKEHILMYKREEIAPEKIEEQRALCAQIRSELNRERQHYALVDTYGCQQNESDSEILRGWLRDMGYEMTEDEAQADVIVVNTCAIREHAEMRVFGNVGALVHQKKKNPELIVALCGCMAQKEEIREKVKRSFQVVDLCFGPHEVWRFPSLLVQAREVHGRSGNKGRVFAAEESEGVIAEDLPRLRQDGVKAWLAIMNGCNNYCSYCIVPYVRGRERSRRHEDVLREVAELAALGYKDITLLGQNVNSYGKELEGNMDFADLLTAANAIDGDFRLRFMTSHPKDATDKLFEAMAKGEKCMPQLHLPVQAGSDAILHAMNRHYTAEQYLRKVESARKLIPDLVITTDMIVGFPGETEEDFQQTLDLVRAVEFDSMFTFIYSRRPGTKAAALPDNASREEIQDRFDRLTALANEISERRHASCVGKDYRVLIDGKSSIGEYNLTSRTEGGRLVHLKGGDELIGRYADVHVTDSNTYSLFGNIIS